MSVYHVCAVLMETRRGWGISGHARAPGCSRDSMIKAMSLTTRVHAQGCSWVKAMKHLHERKRNEIKRECKATNI